ncbi:DUF4395 domain-containing protein [Aneurinibacillus tyrosinisolvens]|uniref:DUF4395 domain-containing protein n=1 Tax=Aneurinibacillus tyrosinisolvens TaxID=1443435 RepID=UPI00063F4D59|nr:DUF4395 domain-containing protein [Aneurinibacillus tyrosinisolvens]
MEKQLRSIPRPLVKTNQWFIVICVLLTWTTDIKWFLALPLVSGLLGLFFGFNPVMRFAKIFLKKPLSTYIPEDWDQQQFNQTIAVVCLATGLVSYLAHWTILAYISTGMVALASFVAILGFCIGCFIRYQWTQYRFRRSSN